MTRRQPFALASLCLLQTACAVLQGRMPGDAGPSDGSVDGVTRANVATADATRADVATPAPDAPACPRGEGAAVDPRVSLTLASDVLGHPFAGATARAARLDAAGRIVVAGQCTGCGSMDRAAYAAVWRVDARTLRHDAVFGGVGVAAETSTARPVEVWNAVDVDAQRRAYLAGYAPMSRVAVVARLREDGSADPTFGDAGQLRMNRAEFSSRPEFVFPVALRHDDDGTVVALIDQLPWGRWPERAWLLRLDDAGRLDAAFGEGGMRELDETHGCFDIARDGGDYVVACSNARDRPELRRFDVNGRPMAWPAGGADAPTAPARFMVRTLGRDSAGRWIVAGPVSASYNDSHASVAAVRFLADGTHDRSYGAAGITVFLGPRQTFSYSYAAASRLGCEDRLLVGANYNQQGVVGLFDADGRTLDAVGDVGNVLLPLRPGALAAAVEAIVPTPDSQDVVVITSHVPAAVTMFRLGL